MKHNRDEFSNQLTFSQRYHYEPLPEPMCLEEVSKNLRRKIWNAIREWLLKHRRSSRSYSFDSLAVRFSERILGKFKEQPEDEIRTDYKTVLYHFKKIVLQERFNRVLDLVEIIVNDGDVEDELTCRLKELFEFCAAAYRLDTSQRPYSFFPQTSEAQGEATRQAIETLREGGMDGATAHLRQATEHINAQQYADSIADSIHAVESVARMLDPEASRTLGPALSSLEKAGLLKHPALKQAFQKLYGYTNDEQGIRHALIDKESSNVGLDEAMLMFGACASFAAYLATKHHKMQEQENGEQ